MAVPWSMTLWMAKMVWVALSGWVVSCLTIADEVAVSFRSGDIGLEELSTSIGHLKELRYLNLSDNGNIKFLPRSMSKLVITKRLWKVDQPEDLVFDYTSNISRDQESTFFHFSSIFASFQMLFPKIEARTGATFYCTLSFAYL
ncbi:hypothetical protein RND71_009133 [Anisodus tanguticus]|uniref:Uncharacterized protein n=1 Tax=Anisodus tanguticus TaxID=243964 RepID=A0AAE1VUB6_9SOLA|nr:hypothetical protein RND71_009133 [Anisodus tanguticus]